MRDDGCLVEGGKWPEIRCILKAEPAKRVFDGLNTVLRQKEDLKLTSFFFLA